MVSDDRELVAAVRHGDKKALGKLWELHASGGIRAARALTQAEDAEDLVSEAFVAVWDSIQAGGGPDGAFRPYLYVTIKNLAIKHATARKHLADGVDLTEISAGDTSEETLERALESTYTVTAFKTLPERWQAVLWYTEVEQMSAAQTGRLLGLSTNAAKALAFRARAGLRNAFVQSHVRDQSLPDDCRRTIDMLGLYSRGELKQSLRAEVETHLRTCDRCSIVADELDHVASRIAIVMVPLVFGLTGAGAVFLSSLAGPAPTASAAPQIRPRGSSPAKIANTTIVGPVGFVASIVAIAVAAVVAFASAGTFVPNEPAGAENTPMYLPVLSSETGQVTPAPVDDQAEPPTPPVDDQAAPADVDGDMQQADSPVTPPSASAPSGTPPGPPSPPLFAPLTVNNVISNTGNVYLTGTGEPGATVEVSKPFSVSLTVGPDGLWEVFVAGLAESVYQFQVTQALNGRYDTTPVAGMVTIDWTQPAPPTESAFYPGTNVMHGVTEPGATVQLWGYGTADIYGTVVADENGVWVSEPLNSLASNTIAVGVGAVDAAGNLSSIFWVYLGP